VSRAVLTRLAENDHFLKQKDAAKALLAAMIYSEVGLTQQHALLLKVHLSSEHSNIGPVHKPFLGIGTRLTRYEHSITTQHFIVPNRQ